MSQIILILAIMLASIGDLSWCQRLQTYSASLFRKKRTPDRQRRMKTFRRKPRSDSPEAAPDVIEVSSGTSLSEPLGTKRDGGGGHDSDDNSPPEKLWLGVSSGQPKEKNSKGSGATKLRKKRKKKAKYASLLPLSNTFPFEVLRLAELRHVNLDACNS